VSLTSDHQLRDAIFALRADIGALHTVSGVGFADADAGRVQKAFETVAQEAHWKFIDLRGTTDAAAQTALTQAPQADTWVVATRPDEPPRPLVELVRAYIDRRPQARSRAESLVVVCDGCDSSEQLSAELLRVPYWDFLG
jgi:hypothetical protein